VSLWGEKTEITVRELTQIVNKILRKEGLIMKTKLIISMLVFAFLVGVSTAVTSPDNVLKLWKLNYGKIDSVPLEISYTERLIEASSTIDPNYAENKPYLIKIHRIQQGHKFFATILTQRNPSEEPVTTETSYDGISQRVYRPSLKEGIIFSGRSGSNIEANSLKNYLLANPPYPIEQMFSGSEQDPNYSLSVCDPNTLNGVTCEGFKLLKVGWTTPKFELWVAPDKGMLPMIFKRFNWSGDLILKLEVFEVGQSKGLWYPKKAKMSINLGRGAQVLIYEIVVDKFVLNPEVDPNIFKMKFSVGTTVLDYRIKESYEVGLD